MTLALSLIGFAVLLLSMQRHGQDWLGRPPRAGFRLWLRASGLGLQLAALVCAALGSGLAYGTVVWLGTMTIAAAIVIAANCNRSRLQHWFGGVRG